MASMANMNGLGSAAAGPGSAPAAPSTLRQRLLLAHSAAKSMFEKTGELVGRTDRARVQLEHLTALGDMIAPEDVIKSAGRLVAGGEDPLALAGLLADMPDNPQALQGWVAQHAQQAAQTEQQVLQTHAAARHQLGVSALHVLQAHGQQGGQMNQPTGELPGQLPPSANALTGGTP